MKKLLFIFCTFICLALTSCSKPEGKNEYGWYTNYQECLAQAKKDDKGIILVISHDETDQVSAELKRTVLHTPEFATEFGKDFYFCENDVSPTLFKKARPDKEASSKEKKESKRYQKILEDRMRVETIFGVQNTPTVYLISSDGYVIKDFTYIPCLNVEEFKILLAAYETEIEEKQKLINAILSANGIEKVFAIDNLYENTKINFRYMLTNLMREVESLDKENKTGLVGKYIMSIASSDAIDAYINRKPEIIADIYEKAAEHPMLNNNQRQQQYFAAAFVVGSNSPTPEQTLQMIEYLEKAIAVDPNSQLGKVCAERLEQVKEFKGRQDAAEARKKAESASED